MKMIGYAHFICHSYCYFSVLSHIILSDRIWRSGRSLMTSSDSVSKIISCSFSCFVPDFFYHQYGICRMYSKENPQYFRLPVSGFYPGERVMLFLSTFLNNSSFAALPLRTKEVDIPYFVQNFLLALLAYMEPAATHLTLTFMSFCCIRIQSLSRIPSLKVLKEMCSINDMPSICMLPAFASNSTDLVSLPLTMGRI